MTAHQDFANTIIDLLSQALHAPVRTRRMFGGFGFYCDDLFIAVLVAGELYLKTNSDTAQAFAAEGLQPWFYVREGKPVTMGFHPVPDAALDSPHELRPWARLAVTAALAARADKPPKRKKGTPP